VKHGETAGVDGWIFLTQGIDAAMKIRYTAGTAQSDPGKGGTEEKEGKKKRFGRAARPAWMERGSSWRRDGVTRLVFICLRAGRRRKEEIKKVSRSSSNPNVRGKKKKKAARSRRGPESPLGGARETRGDRVAKHFRSISRCIREKNPHEKKPRRN